PAQQGRNARMAQLEPNAQSELHGAVRRAIRSRVLVIYHAKRSWRIDIGSRIVRSEVVQDVHELERERCTDPLRNPEVLRDRCIQGPERKATNSEAPRTCILTQQRPPELIVDGARVPKQIHACVSTCADGSGSAGRDASR